jgi:hypothetical protein
MWPKDTMAAKVAFYGDPRGPHGVDEKWFACNVVRVIPPWKMTLCGQADCIDFVPQEMRPCLKAALR